MEQKDYYRILGVKPDATQKEIKAAYRRLAFQYHPDRNKAEDAAMKMKEINESYAVISDTEKRAQYDALRRTFGASAYGKFRQNYSDQDIFRGSDINQIFEEISRAFGFRSFDDIFGEFYGPGYRTFEFRQPGGFGKRLVFRVPAAGKNAQGTGSVLDGNLGRLVRYGLKKIWGLELPQRGKDRYDRITLSPALARTGGKIRYLCRIKGKEILVSVPPGIRDGQQIRLRGLGDEGKGGGEPGDLYARVRIRTPLSKKIRDLRKRIGF